MHAFMKSSFIQVGGMMSKEPKPGPYNRATCTETVADSKGGFELLEALGMEVRRRNP
jgi:hypothetical protein